MPETAETAPKLTPAQESLLNDFVDNLLALGQDAGRRANDAAVAEGAPVMSREDREQWEAASGFNREHYEALLRQEMKDALAPQISKLNDAEIVERREDLKMVQGDAKAGE